MDKTKYKNIYRYIFTEWLRNAPNMVFEQDKDNVYISINFAAFRIPKSEWLFTSNAFSDIAKEGTAIRDTLFTQTAIEPLKIGEKFKYGITKTNIPTQGINTNHLKLVPCGTTFYKVKNRMAAYAYYKGEHIATMATWYIPQ